MDGGCVGERGMRDRGIGGGGEEGRMMRLWDCEMLGFWNARIVGLWNAGMRGGMKGGYKGKGAA